VEIMLRGRIGVLEINESGDDPEVEPFLAAVA
jgi:hypothetical protein